MPIDYKALSEDNLRRYGTDIAEWAPDLLANLYHERTHFVFELLQNAEDAIKRRNCAGSNSVKFELLQTGLKVSHFGKPFDESDVRGICGINKSTKKTDLTSIGRFGIGFKSVYAFTDRPEIHSAGEHFAIDAFVHPVEIAPQPTQKDETIFWLPFKADKQTAFAEICQGLANLGTSTLLFLQWIDEIVWSVEEGPSGNYYRALGTADQNSRQVTLLGQSATQLNLDTEEYLIFSRPVYSDEIKVGAAEIAFALDVDANSNSRIKAVSDARLVAFFPTIVPTNLGFLLQAPYRTTPGRDNVPPKDAWNQHLVAESASLLVEALTSLKERGLLSVDVFNSLPLDKTNFANGTMFEPIYRSVAEAFKRQALLPTNNATWVPSDRAALARGQELRHLVDSHQLTKLFSPGIQLEWLSDNVTLSRTPALRNYLMYEHEVREILPLTFLNKITKEFLEAQSDEWISSLYQFLLEQSHLLKNAAIASKPWVRLENGWHVVAHTDDQPNAFLPSQTTSGFPTVKASVCTTQDALKFLKSLKLTEPDPVDDIVANVLPLYSKYTNQEHDPDLYRKHLNAIEAAYATPLREQRTKLIAALKESYVIPATDYDGNKSWLRPSDCYLPTERLKKLFEGVSGVDFLDDAVAGLQGEIIRDILIACGTARYLETIPPKTQLSSSRRQELREKSSEERCSGGEQEVDRTLRGLEQLLDFMGTLSDVEGRSKSLLLWDALCDVIQDKRQSVVKATYFWFYFKRRQVEHDAAFIRILKNTKWIPAPDGRLEKPAEVVFEHLDPRWTLNPVLQSALGFKPPIIDLLAKEAGLEPGLLKFLKKSGLTTEAQLRECLGDLINTVQQPELDDQQDATKKARVAASTDASSDGLSNAPKFRPSLLHTSSRPSEGSDSTSASKSYPPNGDFEKSEHGQRTFISYLAVSVLDEEDADVSDAETQQERMRVERSAIDHILTLEPTLQMTPPGNAGFDLFGVNNEQQPNRWIEVKAMVGTLSDHPVGMSRRQFVEAQCRENNYWLYIVENATSDAPHVLKIQNPAGSARTFTFDQGWRDVAISTQVDIQTWEILEA